MRWRICFEYDASESQSHTWMGWIAESASFFALRLRRSEESCCPLSYLEDTMELRTTCMWQGRRNVSSWTIFMHSNSMLWLTVWRCGINTMMETTIFVPEELSVIFIVRSNMFEYFYRELCLEIMSKNEFPFLTSVVQLIQLQVRISALLASVMSAR